MNIQQDINPTPYQIEKFLPGEIWINQKAYRQSVFISPEIFLPSWPVMSIDSLTSEHLSVVVTNPPQIFILGTGDKHVIPEHKIFLKLYELGIGVEIMDSRKAAYTYIVLAQEGRQVAAGIIL